jgi:tetratricopeptide (TPR) repeat protein
MHAGMNALKDRNFDDAQKAYTEAVELAEKMHPHDDRLVGALQHLGLLYQVRDHERSNSIFEREIKIADELYGPGNAASTQALQFLGDTALHLQDYVTAKNYFSRALDVNEKMFGEMSAGFSTGLRMMSTLYLVQKDYEKAEPYLLRAVKIDEKLYGYDGLDAQINLGTLCYLYDAWGKPDKSEPCDRHLIALLEKGYGANGPQLKSTLTSEAKALRSLGRAAEAAEMEKRVEAIQAAAVQPN